MLSLASHELLTTPLRGGERSFITTISQTIYKWKRRLEEYLPKTRLLVNAKADIRRFPLQVKGCEIRECVIQ